jgi:hypothetical protein
VVSCGTCFAQLQGYEFDKIFPGSRIIDIHEYLLEKGITLANAGSFLFHDPCHSPMKLQEPLKTVKALLGNNVIQSERCCGESGTLALNRPDVSTQVRSGWSGAGRQPQNPDLVPGLSARSEPLRGGPERRSAGGGLHRGRDGEPDSGRAVDAGLRQQSQ